MKPGPDRYPVPKGRPFQTHSLQIILFGPFTYEPNVILGLLKIVSLQLAPSVGKACALAQVAMESCLLASKGSRGFLHLQRHAVVAPT